MITIVADIMFTGGRHVSEFRGLSTDVKPSGKINGSKFYELDTGKTYWYNEDSGSWIEESSAYLDSITVNAEEATTTYTAGELFDDTGLVVTAKYTDGTTDTVDDFTYSPAGALSTSDTKVTISYTENGITRTADVDITVTAE